MDIKVGKYIIKSDQYNLWIEEEYQAKIKKKDGETGEKTRTRNITGYHHNWTGLINSFITKGINRSDATEVKDLLRDIAAVKREAIELSVRAYEEGKAMKA